MKRIKYKDILSTENIKLITDAVYHDKLIIYPTDTLYGLGGNFFSKIVIEKIDTLKKRKDMPYSIVVSGLDMLRRIVVSIPDIFYKLNQEFLPGKFTFLFPVAKTIDPELVKNSDKIGVRIPNVLNILKLVDLLNIPLITTSVNSSGEPPMNDPDMIFERFSEIPTDSTPSILIDAGVFPKSKGSTIFDITQTPPSCIRIGDDFDKISNFFR